MRHRTHTGSRTKRSTISLQKSDVELLDTVYAGLQEIYKCGADKPSLSAILLVTLKRAVRDDPNFLPEIHAELQEACKRKKPINPFREWA